MAHIVVHAPSSGEFGDVTVVSDPVVDNADFAALCFGLVLCISAIIIANRTGHTGVERQQKVDDEQSTLLDQFKRRYLPAYLFAFFADWTMGVCFLAESFSSRGYIHLTSFLFPYTKQQNQAYIYTLYSSYYHYDMNAIAQLFIVGFGSALVVGTYVGKWESFKKKKYDFCAYNLKEWKLKVLHAQ